MQAANLLRATLDTVTHECWQREQTAIPVRAFAVRLTLPAVRSEKQQRFLVWSWVHRLADSVGDPQSGQPTRVAVDETAVRINGEWSWVYDAIILDEKVLLDIAVFRRRGTDPMAVFLHGLTEKHNLSDTEFLVDGAGYLTSL